MTRTRLMRRQGQPALERVSLDWMQPSRRALGALPSPLWGGVGGGGRKIGAPMLPNALPPSPTLPHKGGREHTVFAARVDPVSTIGARAAPAITADGAGPRRAGSDRSACSNRTAP